MNLVSLLVATSVVKYSHNVGLRVGVALVAVAIVVTAIVISKRQSSGLAPSDPGDGAAAVTASDPQSVSAPQPAGDGTNGTAPAGQAQQTTS
jgi:K(+)-stimulated pyrophosphate-energized sodium pump